MAVKPNANAGKNNGAGRAQQQSKDDTRKGKPEDKAKPGTQVANNSDIPEHLRAHMGSNAGNEQVDSGDVTIPRIELVQDLSKCLKSKEPSYIEGIKVGNMYNNVTRAIYGDAIVVIPVFFRKEYLLWKDRESGGGFAGAYPDMKAANDARLGLKDPDDYEAVETMQQIVLIVHDDDSMEEAVISMAKSKAKVGRDWNALIRMAGGPRFSRTYILSTVESQNANGDYYRNFAIAPDGFVSKEQFEHAQKLYEMITAGRVTIDNNFDEDAIEGETGEM